MVHVGAMGVKKGSSKQVYRARGCIMKVVSKGCLFTQCRYTIFMSINDRFQVVKGIYVIISRLSVVGSVLVGSMLE